MSMTIRLAKFGKKNAPTYKVVVSETRTKRNGFFLDTIGSVNPQVNPPAISIDKEKYEVWKSKGAQVTKAVEKVIDGTYTYERYSPKGKEKAAADQTQHGSQEEAETTETSEGAQE